MSDPALSTASPDERVRALERPHESLLKLYAIRSLAGFVFAPVIFLPLYFKYRTLRYAIDEEGISVSWGALFRREIHLTFRRIQDIHVRRDLFERWLGIATVQIQTASGSAEAEMSLVGIRDHEAVRDFLYRRMRGLESGGGGAMGPGARVGAVAGTDRGAMGPGGGPAADRPSAGGGPSAAVDDELLALLREIRDELVAARTALEDRR